MGQKSQRTCLAKQSLETGFQPFLLLHKCSAIESSYSSAPRLNISTSIYFAYMKPSLRSIARSVCHSPWVLPPPSQTNHCGSHRLLDCMESSTSTSQMGSRHSWTPAQTSNTNLCFPPCWRDTTAFFHQSPEAGCGPRVTDLSFSLVLFVSSVTGWPCFTYFITTSIQAMLSLSYRDLPSLTAKEQVTCSHMLQTCFASMNSCFHLEQRPPF